MRELNTEKLHKTVLLARKNGLNVNGFALGRRYALLCTRDGRTQF